MREFITKEAEGNYSITFETDDRKAFEKVQELCRMLIDAVYVIRCKECKYWEMEKYIGGEGMACQFMPCDGNVNITEPTDFCCWAERKEE